MGTWWWRGLYIYTAELSSASAISPFRVSQLLEDFVVLSAIVQAHESLIRHLSNFFGKWLSYSSSAALKRCQVSTLVGWLIGDMYKFLIHETKLSGFFICSPSPPMKWNVLRLLKHELDYKNSEKTEWNGGSSKEIFPSSSSSFLCSLFFGITVWKREEIEVLYSTRFYVKWRKKRRGFSKWWRFAERCNPWCNRTSTGTAFSLFDIPLPARKLELLTVLRNGSHKQQTKIVNFF